MLFQLRSKDTSSQDIKYQIIIKIKPYNFAIFKKKYILNTIIIYFIHNIIKTIITEFLVWLWFWLWIDALIMLDKIIIYIIGQNIISPFIYSEMLTIFNKRLLWYNDKIFSCQFPIFILPSCAGRCRKHVIVQFIAILSLEKSSSRVINL